MAPTVDEVVEGLAEQGASGFHASFVARRAGISGEEAHRELARLVSRGELDLDLEAICPTCHRTVATWRSGDPIALDELTCSSCGEAGFTPERDELLLAYAPSRDYLLRRNRAKKRLGPRARQTGLKTRLRRLLASTRSRGTT